MTDQNECCCIAQPVSLTRLRPQGVRTVQQVVGAAASVTPFVRHHKKRCQLHIQATYYRVGADEVKAASEGANAEEVLAALCFSCSCVGHL